MAKVENLSRKQKYMLHAINFLEATPEIQATIIAADFEAGAVALFGRDSQEYRDRLREIMRRCW